MLGLSIGVSRISHTLPDPVYALLSGVNASTVGLITLAAVQLSARAITDKLTRILLFLSAAAGLLYNALWYFPVILVSAGIVTIIWDLWVHSALKSVVGLFKRSRGPQAKDDVESQPRTITDPGMLGADQVTPNENDERSADIPRTDSQAASPEIEQDNTTRSPERDKPREILVEHLFNVS